MFTSCMKQRISDCDIFLIRQANADRHIVFKRCCELVSLMYSRALLLEYADHLIIQTSEFKETLLGLLSDKLVIFEFRNIFSEDVSVPLYWFNDRVLIHQIRLVLRNPILKSLKDMQSQTDPNTLFNSLSQKLHKWYNPPTHAQKNERNKKLKNFVLFAISTITLIAFNNKISRFISLDRAAALSQARI